MPFFKTPMISSSAIASENLDLPHTLVTSSATGSGRESEGELHGGVFGGDGAVPEADDERRFGVGGVAEALGQIGGPVHEEQPKERILAFAEDDRALTDDR